MNRQELNRRPGKSANQKVRPGTNMDGLLVSQMGLTASGSGITFLPWPKHSQSLCDYSVSQPKLLMFRSHSHKNCSTRTLTAQKRLRERKSLRQQLSWEGILQHVGALKARLSSRHTPFKRHRNRIGVGEQFGTSVVTRGCDIGLAPKVRLCWLIILAQVETCRQTDD